MTATIQENITLETEMCCNCAVVFAMPSYLKRQRRDDGLTFHCPNGHPQHYTKTTVMQLTEQLEAAQRELRSEKCHALRMTQERDQAQRKLKRVHRGVCPCCKRSFTDLARHMQTKHPEVVKAK